jgi:hypothetical protein
VDDNVDEIDECIGEEMGEDTGADIEDIFAFCLPIGYCEISATICSDDGYTLYEDSESDEDEDMEAADCSGTTTDSRGDDVEVVDISLEDLVVGATNVYIA